MNIRVGCPLRQDFLWIARQFPDLKIILPMPVASFPHELNPQIKSEYQCFYDLAACPLLYESEFIDN